jgi:hypothetical protein
MGRSRRHPPKPIARHPHVDSQGEQGQMKRYYIQTNIGKAKYVVNHHNGESTHRDGSPFWDMSIFKNKKKLAKFVSYLQANGYQPI